MTALEEIIARADTYARNCQRWGDHNHRWHFVLGVGAIAVGVIAGIVGGAGVASWIPGGLGLVAGGLGGVGSFASPEDRAQWHYKRIGDFDALGNEGRQLVDREARTPGSVPQAEVSALNEKLGALQSCRFSRGSRPARSPV